MRDLADFLNAELARRSWSGSELARRARVAQSLVSDVVNQKSPATERFCIRVADALGESPLFLLHLAGIREQPPQVIEEAEIVEILRTLSPQERQTALSMLRGLRGTTTPNITPNADTNATPPCSHITMARRVAREEIERREREREHAIATLLSGLEAAGVDMAEVQREAEQVLLLRHTGKETREEDDLFT